MANIHVKKTNIEGLYVIEPIVFSDHRGICFETYNYEAFSSYGLNYNFVQDNESVSKKGDLRGMHVNMKHPQGKLIRVLSGEILDVVIDLRKESKTYMSCFSICLSAQNYKQLYIPKGMGISCKPGVWHWAPNTLDDSVHCLVIFKNNTSHEDIYFDELPEEIGLEL